MRSGETMKRWMRILGWVLVAVVPGGTCLLPLLIGDAIIRRRRKARTERPATLPSSDLLAETGRR